MRTFVGGLLRDGEDNVAAIAAFAEALHAELGDVDVFVYENNSRDASAQRLAAAAAERPFLHARSETWDLDAFREASKARTWDNRPCRLELIAEARNRLLDWVREHDPGEDDRVVVIDWDFASAPPVEPLARWLRDLPGDVDAVFANGVDGRGRYYDLYEIRTADHPLGPELLGDAFWHSRRRQKDLRRVIDPAEPPIPVYSAFSGMAVYRAGALDGCRYSPYPTPELHAYHLERLRDDADNPEVRALGRDKRAPVRDGVLAGIQLFGDDVLYWCNSGFNFPIAAEHVNLHLAMRARGRGRFLIAPDLRYVSNH